MGEKNYYYNEWLKAQKKGFKGSFDEFMTAYGAGAPDKSVTLTQGFSSWAEIADYYYHDQRWMQELKNANPGIGARFSPGMTLTLPGRTVGYSAGDIYTYDIPEVSYDFMAKEFEKQYVKAGGTPGYFYSSTYGPTTQFWETQPLVKQGKAPEGYENIGEGKLKWIGEGTEPSLAAAQAPTYTWEDLAKVFGTTTGGNTEQFIQDMQYYMVNMFNKQYMKSVSYAGGFHFTPKQADTAVPFDFSVTDPTTGKTYSWNPHSSVGGYLGWVVYSNPEIMDALNNDRTAFLTDEQLNMLIAYGIYSKPEQEAGTQPELNPDLQPTISPEITPETIEEELEKQSSIVGAPDSFLYDNTYNLGRYYIPVNWIMKYPTYAMNPMYFGLFWRT